VSVLYYFTAKKDNLPILLFDLNFICILPIIQQMSSKDNEQADVTPHKPSPFNYPTVNRTLPAGMVSPFANSLRSSGSRHRTSSGSSELPPVHRRSTSGVLARSPSFKDNEDTTSRITTLRDHHQNTQAKTFLRWVNGYMEMKMKSLEEFDNGVNLVQVFFLLWHFVFPFLSFSLAAMRNFALIF
jgi:hypothetical protein